MIEWNLFIPMGLLIRYLIFSLAFYIMATTNMQNVYSVSSKSKQDDEYSHEV